MHSLNIITVIVCAFCIFLASISYVRFSIKIRGLRRILMKSEGELEELNESKISGVVSDYSATMDANKKTSEYAPDYFNLSTLTNSFNIHLKVFSAMPSVLTSIGIMGTFLGLTQALLLFNSDTTEAIRDSINSLLDGMGTAFITSLVGMFCSSVYLLCEKRQLSKTEAVIGAFCGKVDKRYHISSENALLSAFIQKDDDDFDVLPGEALAKMGKDLSSMNTTMETFGTDLYDSIGKAMDNSFDEKLVPILNDLAQKMENPAQTVVNSLVGELERIGNELKESLTKDIDEQMNVLLKRFIDASDSINNIPNVISEVNSTMRLSAEDNIKANKAFSETLDAQIQRMEEKSAIFAKDIAEASMEITKMVDTQIERMHEISDTFADEVSKMLDEQTIRLTDLSNSFAENIEKATTSAEKLTNINESLSNVPETIDAASQSIVAATTSLDKASTSIESSSGVLGDALEYVKEANETTGLTVQKYTEEIASIQAGLKVIFGQVQEGLNKYAEATRDGLQTMLDPFSTTLTDATTKVTNSIAPLNDAVTDLSNFGQIVKNSMGELAMALKPLEDSIHQLYEVRNKIASDVATQNRNQNK